jgi:flagellar basal body-associated protein FliL
MRKSRRVFVILAMPIVVILWCIGWSLYWIGAKKEKAKPKLANQTENLTLAVLLPEEKIEA